MPHVNVAGVVAIWAVKEEHRRSDNGGVDGAARRGQGVRPAGQMKEWLRGYDCDQETLNAEDTAHWLKVRKQEARAERRARLPGRCRGEGVRKAQMDRYRAIGRQMYRANYTKSTFHDEEGN